jgi:hypothetical protein
LESCGCAECKRNREKLKAKK